MQNMRSCSAHFRARNSLGLRIPYAKRAQLFCASSSLKKMAAILKFVEHKLFVKTVIVVY